MEFLLDKKQAKQVEEAYEENFVYIWLKGPCLDLRSRRQIINPSSVFYACYQGLDILKKYSRMTDARTSQNMKYLPREIYEELSPKYEDSDVINFCRDEFFVIITLCELLHLTGEGTPQEIAKVMYSWISSTIDRAHSDYQDKLSHLADEIDTEYNYKSPIMIVAKGVERDDSIHHNGEDTIISYVRGYLRSERRISEEIKELLRNNGDMSKVKGLAQRDAMPEVGTSEGASRENVERLEKRVKKLEGMLEEKEKELAEMREGMSSAADGTPIRIAKGKKSRTIVLLAAMFYAKFFESTDATLTNRDHFLNAILRYGFGEKEQKSLRQTLDNYEDRFGKMDGLKQDLRRAVDDTEEDMSGKTDGLEQDFRQAVDAVLNELKSFQNEEKFPAKPHQGDGKVSKK